MKITKAALSFILAAGLIGVAGCGGPADSPEADAPAPEMSSSSMAADPEPSAHASMMEEAPSSEAPAAEGAEASEEAVITVEGFKFIGPESVSPGATITVVNKDVAPHTVTSEEEGVFDVEFGSEETVTFTAPEEPGEYPYICSLHPAMMGTLVVE